MTARAEKLTRARLLLERELTCETQEHRVDYVSSALRLTLDLIEAGLPVTRVPEREPDLEDMGLSPAPDFAAMVEQAILQFRHAAENFGEHSLLTEAADALTRLVAPLPAEVAEEAGYLRMLAKATVPDLPHVTLPDSMRDIADMLESLARENARLAAELAALSEAAMDADLHCWGPGFVSPEHAAPYAKALRLLCQPNADRSNAAWKLLDEMRRLAAENAELREKLDLRVADLALNVKLRNKVEANNVRLRAELESANDTIRGVSDKHGDGCQCECCAVCDELDEKKGG